jgi:hypothetical protein
MGGFPGLICTVARITEDPWGSPRMRGTGCGRTGHGTIPGALIAPGPAAGRHDPQGGQEAEGQRCRDTVRAVHVHREDDHQ